MGFFLKETKSPTLPILMTLEGELNKGIKDCVADIVAIFTPTNTNFRLEHEKKTSKCDFYVILNRLRVTSRRKKSFSRMRLTLISAEKLYILL